MLLGLIISKGSFEIIYLERTFKDPRLTKSINLEKKLKINFNILRVCCLIVSRLYEFTILTL